MRRTVQLKVAVFLTVLALVPSAPLAAAAQRLPDVQINESLSTNGGTAVQDGAF